MSSTLPVQKVITSKIWRGGGNVAFHTVHHTVHVFHAAIENLDKIFSMYSSQYQLEEKFPLQDAPTETCMYENLK